MENLVTCIDLDIPSSRVRLGDKTGDMRSEGLQRVRSFGIVIGKEQGPYPVIQGII